MTVRAFQSHPRSFEENLYAYPVLSRRARGLSVGVNLSPHKACNMDCVYCQVDRGVPAAVKTVDLDRMEEELTELLARGADGSLLALAPFSEAPEELRTLADIAFSGDGEPTSFRGFLDACRRAVRAKEAAGVPDLPVRIITNGIDLDRAEVVEALAFLDGHAGEVWAKLDAGTQEYYDRVNRTATPLAKVVENVREAARIRPVVIQALFLSMDGEPTPDAEIEAWILRLREITQGGGSVSLVQVYTVARPPAEAGVAAVSGEHLARIAGLVRGRLGLRAEVYR